MRIKKKISKNTFKSDKIILLKFKKTKKYFFLSFILAFLISFTFYIYTHQNQKFEILLRLDVNKLTYDHYDLDTTSFYGEIKKIIKDSVILNESIIKKKHKLYFGPVNIIDQSLYTTSFETYVYGINFDKDAIEKFFNKIKNSTEEEFKKGLIDKLKSLKISNDYNDLLINEEINKYFFLFENNNYSVDYELASAIENNVQKLKNEKAIEIIINDKNHFSYNYSVRSKILSVLSLSIIAFIFTFLVIVIVIGLYFAGKRLLLNDQIK